MNNEYNPRFINGVRKLKKLFNSLLAGSAALFFGLALIAYSSLVNILGKIYILCGKNLTVELGAIAGIIIIALILNFIEKAVKRQEVLRRK
ncbi:MAG: hypothetical protein Q8936_16915 [Bacillota bacterium]|nr:hypothetical protein [Bacillota bacterium]